MLHDLRTAPADNDAIMINHITADDVVGDVILFTGNIDEDYNMTYAIIRDYDDEDTVVVYSVEVGAPSYVEALSEIVDNPDDYDQPPADVLALAARLF